MTDVAQKLWGFCNVLRHDGMGYTEYLEQLTFLLFLKMAEERDIALPSDSDWSSITRRSGLDLLDHYAESLRRLGQQEGLLGNVFSRARSSFSDPANLKRLTSLIDEVDWTSLDVDVKAEALEGLLERAASEGKKGAGQYFTPRLLIRSIVGRVQPDPRRQREFAIGDPACGTGGFLVAAYEWLLAEAGGAIDRELAVRLKHETYFGQDFEQPRRLALMNLYLHGLEPELALGDSIYNVPTSRRFDVILSNPPFGTRGAGQAPTRDDFTVATSNKQLNFLQHILTLLKPGGRAAVILPDNCLFADKAGEVFEILVQDCDLHTVLRLPRGTFSPYSPGTKTNVIFFAKGRPTERTWIYDARSNVRAITKKDRPLTPLHFVDFERCFGDDAFGQAARAASDSPDDRWREFNIGEIEERDFKLDSLRWLRDETLDDDDAPPEPEGLAIDVIADLESAILNLNQILDLLGADSELGGTTT